MTQLYNSDDLDHFGDSDAEDDDTRKSDNSNQGEKYRDEEKEIN